MIMKAKKETDQLLRFCYSHIINGPFSSVVYRIILQNNISHQFKRFFVKKKKKRTFIYLFFLNSVLSVINNQSNQRPRSLQ